MAAERQQPEPAYCPAIASSDSHSAPAHWPNLRLTPGFPPHWICRWGWPCQCPEVQLPSQQEQPAWLAWAEPLAYCYQGGSRLSCGGHLWSCGVVQCMGSGLVLSWTAAYLHTKLLMSCLTQSVLLVHLASPLLSNHLTKWPLTPMKPASW